MPLLKHKLLFLLAYFIACSPITQKKEIQMNWAEFDLDLPEGIIIYEGFNKSMPLKAWVAKVDLSQDYISASILSSTDRDRKETPLHFLEHSGARIVLNGGYFLMGIVILICSVFFAMKSM